MGGKLERRIGPRVTLRYETEASMHVANIFRVDRHARVALAEVLGSRPVRGRALAVEQARLREQEGKNGVTA